MKDDVEYPLLFAAIRKPRVRKMRVVNSADVLQGRDELGKVLETRPLFIDAINGRLHHDEMSGGVHSGLSELHRLNQVARR